MIPADEIAARLTKARADRTAIGSLSASFDGFDLAAAYEVQRILRREAGPLAGWKLGVTSRAKQAQIGVHEPVRGHLAAADALDLGSPLVVAEHIQPRCEPEIVFIMGADLSGPAVTSSAVLTATAAVAVGIEVLDSRYTDYKFTMPDVVADNTSAGRYVVGSAVPVAGLDLRLLGVVLEHNGEVVATASGAAALGHPAAAVAWLVRSLAVENEGLRAGDIVLSGGLTAAVPVKAGDVVTATADRLGSVELGCVCWTRTGAASLYWYRSTALPGGPSGRSRTPGARTRCSRFPVTWLLPTGRARTTAGRWSRAWSGAAWSPARGTGTATSWPPGGAGRRSAIRSAGIPW